MTPARLGLLSLALVFAADQASKWAVLEGLGLREGVSLALTPVLDLTLVWNRGISYGLLRQDSDLGRWLLIALSLAASLGLGAWMVRAGSSLLALSLGLVVGGALGNALDRVVHGAVVDFVHLHWGAWSWYVFNVADAAIVAGVGLLLYDSLRPVPRAPVEGAPAVAESSLDRTPAISSPASSPRTDG